MYHTPGCLFHSYYGLTNTNKHGNAITHEYGYPIGHAYGITFSRYTDGYTISLAN